MFTGHLITPNRIKIWILKRAKVGRIIVSVARIYDKFIVRIGIKRLNLKQYAYTDLPKPANPTG